MEQKALSRWLKIIIVGIAVCGIGVFAVVIPAMGLSIRSMYPEFENRFWPWLVFMYLTAMPFLAALWFGWKITCNIGADRSFSRENGRYLGRIAILAGGDAAFFFLGNVVLLLMNMSHPGIVILAMIVAFAGGAVSVAAAALSHLANKAAILQEQSDLTI